MTLETRCENCGHDGVELHSFAATVTGVPIMPDGFDISMADEMNTYAEDVICPECGYIDELHYKEEKP